jgi:hypothetical protein
MALDQRQRLRWTGIPTFRVDVDHFAASAFLRLQKMRKHAAVVLAGDGKLQPLIFLKRRDCFLQINDDEQMPLQLLDGKECVGVPPLSWAGTAPFE